MQKVGRIGVLATSLAAVGLAGLVLVGPAQAEVTTSADSCRWYVESAAKIYRQPSTSSPADGMAYPRQEVQVSRYSYNGRVYFVQNRTTGVNGWVEKRHIESARVRRAPKAGSR